MTGHRFKPVIVIAVPLLCIHSCLLAEDIVTRSGKRLKNAEIVSLEGDQIVIKYDGGREKFAATEIPDNAQKRFRDQELKRKADEVQKLKQELARREKELQQLQRDKERLRHDPEQNQVRHDAELQTLKAENARPAG